MVFWPSGRDHDSQNQLYLFWRTPRYFKNIRKMPNLFWEILFWEISAFSMEIDNFQKKWKRRRPTNPDDPSDELFRILNMGSISIKNMRWKFGTMGSISSRKHKMEIWQYGINIYQHTWTGNLVMGNQYFQENMQWHFGKSNWRNLNKGKYFISIEGIWTIERHVIFN